MLVAIVVATIGGRSLLTFVDIVQARLPGQAELMRALAPRATPRDHARCSSSDCTLATISPRQAAEDSAAFRVTASARLLPEPARRIAFGSVVPLRHYGIEFPAAWAAQGRFVEGLLRWSTSQQYLRRVGAAWADVERPPPGSGLRPRLDSTVDGPGIIEHFVPADPSQRPLTPAGVRQLLALTGDQAEAADRWIGFDFRPIPNPLRIRLDPGHAAGLSDGDWVRVRVGASDPGRPTFEGHLEGVARHPDGSVAARIRVDGTLLEYLPSTIARGLDDVGSRRSSWPLSLEIDRRFGSQAGARFRVPSTALAERGEGGEDWTATLWLMIQEVAIPVSVAVIAEADGEALVAERVGHGRSAVRPDHWRALTPLQRAVLVRRAASGQSPALLGSDTRVIERPGSALQPGMRVRPA